MTYPRTPAWPDWDRYVLAKGIILEHIILCVNEYIKEASTGTFKICSTIDYFPLKEKQVHQSGILLCLKVGKDSAIKRHVKVVYWLLNSKWL